MHDEPRARLHVSIGANAIDTEVPGCDVPALIDRWFATLDAAPALAAKLDTLITVVTDLSTLTKEKLMAVSAQIQAFSDRVNAATNEIAADLQALRDKIAAGTALTPEDTALLDAAAARLEAMGKDPENPVPTPTASVKRSR